jgi:hypothetical protein
MRRFRMIAFAIPLFLVGVVLSSCTSTPSASTGRTTQSTTVWIPAGWKSYTYGRARISVPRTWVVMNDYACPEGSPQGVLFLGPPNGAAASCPPNNGFWNSVTIESMPPVSDLTATVCPPFRMNHLVVYVGPCGTSNPAGITLWTIPTLGIQAEGIGTPNENVTEINRGAVVDRILHTLRSK